MLADKRLEGEFIADTIEAAKEKAAVDFKVPESDIQFEIVTMPKKGIFGKVKTEAKVKALYIIKKTDICKKYVENILKRMKINAEVVCSETEDGMHIEIKTEDVGSIIGRRGETLDSLQYIVSIFANKGENDYSRITIDCGGYREKREQTLIELAKKISKSVIKNGYSTALEPMNPYERRIIHSTVSEIEGVYSKSIGDEPYRKVVIYAVNRKDVRNDGGRRGGGGQHGGNKRKPEPRSLDVKTSFEKNYKRPNPDENVGTGLYGKIEI